MTGYLEADVQVNVSSAMLVDGRTVPQHSSVLARVSFSPSKSKGRGASRRRGVFEALVSRPETGLEIRSVVPKRDCSRGRSAGLFRGAISAAESRA
jgi:hypothetical protein